MSESIGVVPSIEGTAPIFLAFGPVRMVTHQEEPKAVEKQPNHQSKCYLMFSLIIQGVFSSIIIVYLFHNFNHSSFFYRTVVVTNVYKPCSYSILLGVTMGFATKSFSLSIKVLNRLEDEADVEGLNFSAMLEKILRDRYDIPEEEEV